MPKTVADSGWNLTREVKIRVTPWGVFRWGVLLGGGLGLPVGVVLGYLLGAH